MSNNSVKSVLKAFSILEELEKNGPMSIAELSANLNMDKSTTHRLLGTIKESGYITQDCKSKKYQNGIKLFEIGQSVIEGIGLNHVARAYIESLAEMTGETVNLAMRMENKIIYVDKIESSSTIKVGINIGTVIPMYCTGMGKAVLAFMPEEERNKLIKSMKFEKFTENTMTDIDVIEAHLKEIKAQGYSVDKEEYVDGLISYGAPIFDYKGTPIAAISVSFPNLRFKEEHSREYPKLIKSIALKISRHMGYCSPN